MFCIVLFALLSALTTAAPLSLFTSFQWDESTTGYIINGTICQFFILGGTKFLVPCANATLVVDTPNNRWLLDLSVTNGGKFIALPNHSYSIGNSQLGGACAEIPGWTYAKQVAGYQSITSIPGSNAPGKAIYTGLANDIGACQHDLAGTLHVHNQIVLEFDWSQRFVLPFGPGGSGVCADTSGVFEFDINTLDKTSNRDAYFVLPSDCATPLDYCALSYPVGNPCAVPQ